MVRVKKMPKNRAGKQADHEFTIKKKTAGKNPPLPNLHPSPPATKKKTTRKKSY